MHGCIQVGRIWHGDLSWKKSHWLYCERKSQLKERKRPASGPLLKARQEMIKKDQIYNRVMGEVETSETLY